MSGRSRSVFGLLITVNYKSECANLRLLEDLESMNGFSSQDVVIVDNGSGEESISTLRHKAERLPNVQLFVSDTNQGYFGGTKFGLDRYIQQRHQFPDWIIVSNPDIAIDDPDFLLKLVSQNWREVGVLAPRIRLKGSNIDQNPFMKRRPGVLRRASLRAIYSNYPFAALWDWLSRKKRDFLRHRKAGSTKNELSRRVIYAPHGSFLIFSRRFFEAGGFLDDELFLYGEELSVAEICRSLGLPVIFEPELQVWHDEHATTGRTITVASYQRQKRALKHVFSRYFSGRPRIPGFTQQELNLESLPLDAD